ncbi:MAG: hypothetical protein CMO80_14060 [Verrucomicrobiales bacterium]|nr:hypothetical protein [Verrucomicrobiales bacterium]
MIDKPSGDAYRNAQIAGVALKIANRTLAVWQNEQARGIYKRRFDTLRGDLKHVNEAATKFVKREHF